MYTILQPLKQISVEVGECINLFFSTLGSDLGFFNRTIVLTAVGITMCALIIIFLFFMFCDECKIFYGIFSFKRNAAPPEVRESKIRKRLLADIALKLKDNGIKIDAIECETTNELVGKIDNAVKEVRKDTVIEISSQVGTILVRRELIRQANDITKAHTIEALTHEIDLSIDKVIHKASKAVLAIEQSREESIEKITENQASLINNVAVGESPTMEIRSRIKTRTSIDVKTFDTTIESDTNKSWAQSMDSKEE